MGQKRSFSFVGERDISGTAESCASERMGAAAPEHYRVSRRAALAFTRTTLSRSQDIALPNITPICPAVPPTRTTSPVVLNGTAYDSDLIMTVL